MRNKRRVTVLVVLATAAAIAAGGLWASNMGFKLNYPLSGPGAGSNSGRNAIGLPYNRQVGIDVASELLADIGVTATKIEKFDAASDGNPPYPGAAGDFALEAGVGYLVQVSGDTDYIIVGSHDPGFDVVLSGPGAGSNSGRNKYAHPYHGVASTALELLNELAPEATKIEMFDPASDGNPPYPGSAGNFNLTPGSSYLVQVSSDKTFKPAHY